MIGIVLRALLHVESGDGVGNEIYIDDIHAIFRPQWEERQSGEKYKGPHHVELRSLGAAAVTEHDAGTEDSFGYFRQKLANHVLAKLLSARVGIVVGAVPVNRIIFGDNFVLALAGNCDGADVAEAAQTVIVIYLQP